MIRLILSTGFAIALSVSLLADTLVLRDGTRIEGRLVSFRNDVIQFEEQRTFGRGRLHEIERDEVVRIELDAPREREREFAAARPPGMRERQVIVSADVPWNDAGIDVRAGQTIYFEATGNVRWGRDRRDGPAGERNSPSNPNRPMPARPAAALIGKIGNASSDYFFIGGEEGAIRVRSRGRLYLGVNDDYIQDNTGNFRVSVYY